MDIVRLVQRHPVWAIICFAVIELPGAIEAWSGLFWDKPLLASVITRLGGGIMVPNLGLWITAITSPLAVLILIFLVVALRKGLNKQDIKIEEIKKKSEQALSEIPRLANGRPSIRKEDGETFVQDENGTKSSL